MVSFPLDTVLMVTIWEFSSVGNSMTTPIRPLEIEGWWYKITSPICMTCFVVDPLQLLFLERLSLEVKAWYAAASSRRSRIFRICNFNFCIHVGWGNDISPSSFSKSSTIPVLYLKWAGLKFV